MSKPNKFLSHKGEILGYALKAKNNSNKIAYISVGHKKGLATSIQLVESITRTNQFIPEPLIVAAKSYQNNKIE